MMLARGIVHAAGHACALVLMLSPVCAAGAPETEAVAKRVIEDFVVPKYGDLRTAAKMQADRWKEFCSSPTKAGIDELRKAYLGAADAWSAIEFLSYGPSGTSFRAERLSFWPDRQNATSKGLAGLLKGQDEEGLLPGEIAGASAAAQGLPALERLLYESDPSKLSGDTPEARRRCAVGRAIAANVSTIAGDVASEWTSVAGHAAAPEAATEFVTRTVTDLLAGLERVGDLKIKRVVGSSPDSVRPQVAEGWRSGRSLHALAINLRSAETVASLLLKDRSQSSPAVAQIGKARTLAEHLDTDLAGKAAAPATRGDVLKLLDAVTLARRQATEEIPAALGIAVGFNSSDGD